VRESARAELAGLRTFERVAVADAIDANLAFEPWRQTRRRKKLGDVKASFPYQPPLFELRVGEIRVVYTVDQDARVVTVHAVRRKPPELTTEDILR
jgi:mRNA-degrading endonuclease RelE of RelBE toxin-antitoxin system